MNMKQLCMGIIVMLLVNSGLAWAAPAVGREKLTQTVVSVGFVADQLPLAEVLLRLSRQTGLTIEAVPAASGIMVSTQVIAGESIDHILQRLAAAYQLSYVYNEAQQAIVVYAAPLQALYQLGAVMATPRVMNKASIMTESMLAAPVLPTPAGGYYGHEQREEYTTITANRYQEVGSVPVSTLAIDVDTAAYSNIRRYINAGTLPPAAAVRTEEMVNYFTYDYPQPRSEQPLTVTTEVGACPWQPAHQLVMIGLQGQALAKQELPPANLVFLVDVSGSMQDENKLPLLKTAFKMLVKQLRPEDTISLVTYAGQAGVVLNGVSGRDTDKITTAIDSLQAGGSTAGGEGIQLAYKIAQEHQRPDANNRVILATDGDFNVGVSSETGLLQLIEKERAKGIFLSVLGVGTGNIKDNKMELLADHGNGMYAYLDTAREAGKVLVEQLAGTLYTIAKDVKIQVEFNPAQVKYYRLLGYENRLLERQDFNNDQKDAGELGAGQSVTALYEVIPAGSPETFGNVDPLVYQRPALSDSTDLAQVKVRYKEPQGQQSKLLVERVVANSAASTASERFCLAAAVAEYSLLLRDADNKGQASYQQVQQLAAAALQDDPEGYRHEFLQLVKVSALLATK